MYIPHSIRMLKRKLFKKRDGERILKDTYRTKFGGEVNINNPKNFSEHLFARMIIINRHGNKKFTELADKYLVRKYVSDKIGDEYLVKLVWIGDNPEDIPFDSLPEKCVIKTNHGSGGNIVVDSNSDRFEVKRKLRAWLKENYYWRQREYHYYDIPRKILAEEFINDNEVNGPFDYRFWCFNGKAEVIQVDNHTHDINPFFDTKWNKLDMAYRDEFKDCEIKKPKNFEKMLEIASILSADFDFVRVDLYNIHGKIYFGELTFTPAAGNLVFKPSHWDAILGQKWSIQKQR